MAVVDMKGFCQPAQAGLRFSLHPTCLRLLLSILTPLSSPPPTHDKGCRDGKPLQKATPTSACGLQGLGNGALFSCCDVTSQSPFLQLLQPSPLFFLPLLNKTFHCANTWLFIRPPPLLLGCISILLFSLMRIHSFKHFFSNGLSLCPTNDS